MATCHVRRSRRSGLEPKGRRVAEKSMADRGTQRDWAADRATLAAVWGLPALAMLLAVLLLQPMVCCIVWIANLAWMGGACIANARRCDRTHCRYTGPFFLAMAGGARARGWVGAPGQPTMASSGAPDCGGECRYLVGQREIIWHLLWPSPATLKLRHHPRRSLAHSRVGHLRRRGRTASRERRVAPHR